MLYLKNFSDEICLMIDFELNAPKYQTVKDFSYIKNYSKFVN